MTKWFAATSFLTCASWAGWLYLVLQPDLFPERVPIHWNIRLEPDGWASASAARIGLILTPALLTLLWILNWALRTWSPQAFASDEGRRSLDRVMFCVSAFFLYLFGLLTEATITTELRGGLFVGGFFVFFALLGLAMRNVKRNGLVGVRTPWTLANDDVWERTHHLTAWLWVAGGVMGLLLVVVGVPVWIPFVVLMAVAIYPAVYSYQLHRRLPRAGDASVPK